MANKALTRKDIGNIGERVTCEYLLRLKFIVIARNIVRKTGELDVVAEKDGVLHIIEVKTLQCADFPEKGSASPVNPADNLHCAKIKKVVRTAEWYVSDIEWKGEWQVDGSLVWLRKKDGIAYIQYYPQIV